MTLWRTCPRIRREKKTFNDSPLNDMEIAEGTSVYLVRLVFRPYTHMSRAIGTSVAQRQLALPQRQTDKNTDRDRHTDEQTYIKTHRQTRVRTETRQDGQDRNRDNKHKTTDENQETGRETRTVVVYAVHCDACCYDAGWVVAWWSCCAVVCCWWCCVVVRVVCLRLLLGPF